MNCVTPARSSRRWSARKSLSAEPRGRAASQRERPEPRRLCGGLRLVPRACWPSDTSASLQKPSKAADPNHGVVNIQDEPYITLTQEMARIIGLATRADRLGTRNNPCNATSTGGWISGLQSFANVEAPLLARHPGCTHRCDKHRAARPFTSRHGHVVTRLDRSRLYMNRDIATYPKRTNSYGGLSPARLWPCRPLPSPQPPFGSVQMGKLFHPRSYGYWVIEPDA